LISGRKTHFIEQSKKNACGDKVGSAKIGSIMENLAILFLNAFFFNKQVLAVMGRGRGSGDGPLFFVGIDIGVGF